MPLRTTVLLVPSMAAAVELPRRLASTGRAFAGLYPMKVLDLARAVAEPALLTRGLAAWDPGHDALLAARLLDTRHGLDLPADLPRAPLATALARTLSSVRLAGIEPGAIERLTREAATPEDVTRLRGLAALYRGFHDALNGRFADPATILGVARERLGDTTWLTGADILVADDLELEPLERDFVLALARALPLRTLTRERPASLTSSSFGGWADSAGLRAVDRSETVLAPLGEAISALPEALRRLRTTLFESPSGTAVDDRAVELVTAAGEANEVRAVARRLLREASRGVPFEEMGVILPQPREYAPLFTDLLSRMGVPHRLHPSLPLRFGRCARSLLLLLRCRGLTRADVMELLTFAPIPYREILGEDATPRPAQWDAISRDAGVVSGIERWIIGLRAYAESEREQAVKEADERRERGLRRAGDAEALLRVVELLAATLDGLSGDASWGEWSARLSDTLDQWIGTGRDREESLEREAVRTVVADLAGLDAVSTRAKWEEVEAVIEARLEWERVPLEPLASGGVHVGALDAMAGVPFRVVAIVGLAEGVHPGVLRPDPFLLDPEREELNRKRVDPVHPRVARPATRSAKRQLSLFDTAEPEPTGATPLPLLLTTQDRLLEARRAFHRAVGQATERLILSYPRADPRTGRERMPSLFFVATASALAGRPLGTRDLGRQVVEDDPSALPLDMAVDRSERDRARLLSGGPRIAGAIAAGCPFFKGSRRAARSRWSWDLTAHDGWIAPLPADLAARLDPLTSPRPSSASSLATFAECGFRYLLRYVLRLEPVLEPEERMGLEARERGSLFHEVAERFLRERRDGHDLPVRDTPALRERLLQIGDERMEALVAGSPPRYRMVWEMRRARFHDALLSWLAREASQAGRGTPAFFEVGFGVRREPGSREPGSDEPLDIDLGEGHTLRISGKIDRIDVRPDGALVLRDYKTGRAPKDDGSVFRGGRQLQMPFYVLAAQRLFPGRSVVDAFLDYIDGGRQAAFDPAHADSEAFRVLLRSLTNAIAQGLFVQEPSACRFCDFTSVCGPQPLLEARLRRKLRDTRVQQLLRLREFA